MPMLVTLEVLLTSRLLTFRASIQLMIPHLKLTIRQWNGIAVNALFINDVQIDPDKIMTEDWKQKFTQLCTNYSDIIQYNPGTYNGYYGFVNNTIEFTSTPPPKNKAYVPCYSKEMTD